MNDAFKWYVSIGDHILYRRNQEELIINEQEDRIGQILLANNDTVEVACSSG